MVLLLLLLAIAGYLVGLTRGRGNLKAAVATAQAAQLLAVLVDTPTPEHSPTATETPSVTPTPLPSDTPTATTTPSPTPASPEEWLKQYQDLVLEGLNSISDLEFTADRAQAILQRSAQEQELAFAPVSYQLLSETPWMVLAVPRNPQGQSLPTLFWQDANAQYRFHAQSLLTLLDVSSNYNTLLTGVQLGVARSDDLGALHLLLIERPGVQPLLNAYVLAQPAPGADFVVDWRSSDDAQWGMLADSAKIELSEVEGSLLPDIVIDAAVPMESKLRKLINAPSAFVEQPPFAMQWINSRWSYAQAATADPSDQHVAQGYHLNGAALRSTPLTTLGQIIQLARQQDLNQALDYATRLDIVQQAFGFGIGDPAVWLASYLDDNSQPIVGNEVTPLLRFVDNANRQRTYDAYFELDTDGFYRLAAITQADPYEPAQVTPAGAPPTFTPTPGPTTAQTELPITATTVSALGLPTATDTPEGGVEGAKLPTTPLATATTAQTATPTISSTPTQSPTITETPTETPTFTATPSATATDSPTPTDTATPPLPIPTISGDQPAPATGILSLSATANLRGGPGVGFVSLAPVEDQTTVGVFGVTESGSWYLIRIEQAGNGYNGLVGWIFSDLLFITNSNAPLTVYHDDGTSLTPTPPTNTPAPGTPTPTPSPTWSPTPTPLQTPVLSEPESVVASGSNVPAPDGDEQVFVVGGENLPADPLQPLSVTDASGATVSLRVDSAEVQAWSGLWGAPGSWQGANAELLWPGTTLYSRILQNGDSTTRLASRVRLVGAPNLPRAEVMNFGSLASSYTLGNAALLLGVQGTAGFSLLDLQGNLSSLSEDPFSLDWLDGEPLAGLIGFAPQSLAGKNSFLWLRSDGSALHIFAQPFSLIQGVAGDPYGGVWWIETPQIGLDFWQLWQYEPSRKRIVLRLKGSSTFLPSADSASRQVIAPVLVALKPAHLGDYSQVTLYLDSYDTISQQMHTGFFKVDLHITDNNLAEVPTPPQRLLAAGSYRNTPKLNLSGTQLSYLAFENSQPSLTSTQSKPPNQVNLYALAGDSAGKSRTVFTNETRFDFLGPNLEWIDDTQLLVVRSRFAAGGSTSVDRMAVSKIQLSSDGQSANDVTTNGFVVTGGNRLLDVVACREDHMILVLVAEADGSRQLLRWDGTTDPTTLTTLAEPIDDLFACWQAPAENSQ